MIFQKKKLEAPKRVCYRLKEMREMHDIALKDLSIRTKISERHLLALEECRFHDIPYAPIYQKNFIKCYVEALGQDPESFVDQFLLEEIPRDAVTETVPPRLLRSRFSNFPYLLRTVLVGSVVLLFVAYLGFQVKTIVEPPVLTLYAPNNGQVTTDQTLMVQGKTQFEARVTINGQEIKTDGSGEFQESINLLSGINTITIKAQKKHGKEIAETRHVILRTHPQFTLNEEGISPVDTQ